MQVTHKKTGNTYQLLGPVLDTTNKRNGTQAQLYVRDSIDIAILSKLKMVESLMSELNEAGFQFFVRETDEFQEKFDPY